jgi:hypothetical protein
MDWIATFRKEWLNILTVGCVVVAAFVEAWQQATSNLSPGSAVPRLDGELWHYAPLTLLIVAGVLALFHRKSSLVLPLSPATSLQQTSTSFPSISALQGQAPQITFDARQWFRMAYYSPITAEVQQNIKIIAHNFQPSDVEDFYARFIGVGLVSYLHDMTWAYIFKSQFLMLAELNRMNGRMPVAAAKTYYDQAAIDFPLIYENYAFPQWINFMQNQQLLLKHPSDMLEISHRGKDLLKYIAHWGGDINLKSG